MSEFEELLGKTIVSYKGAPGDDTLEFATSDGKRYQMFHSQDCCESVALEDIAGDLGSLVGEPLVLAEESTSNDWPSDKPIEYRDSFTWTFYRLATARGWATLRWLGTSNGYYSESVEFEEINNPE